VLASDGKRAWRRVRRAAARRYRHMSMRLRVGRLSLEHYQPESCLRVSEQPVERARFAAIDVHNHLGRWLNGLHHWTIPDVGELLDVMAALNISAIVNLDGTWGDELERNLDRYDRAHPGRFLTFCHVDWRLLSSRDAGKRLADSLRRSVAAGAGGLKVWKDLGLRVRDTQGRLVLPDDPRLGDLWETAGELGVPVLIHVADPVAFFHPVDRRNERLEELLRYPEMSHHSRRFPSFPRLMDAQEALVAAHPATRFIGAHVAGWAENLTWVSRLLTDYSNLLVDIGARAAELGRQPRAASAFLQRHRDRVLFGSDLPSYPAEDVRLLFRLLETADEHFPYSRSPVPLQGRWRISGLDLPDDVLRAVYRDNALRLLPALDGVRPGRRSGGPSHDGR
jgi:predicted TIM-barrel fold metal-dependent hydrolase